MSEQSKSTSTPNSTPPKSADTNSKLSETPSKSETGKASDSDASTTGNSDAGKSSRESIGGSSAVHYGFFSNVKTPKYRSGWDDIWSKKTKPKKQNLSRTKEPVVISLALDELPEELQESLADAARAQLKKLKINYDKRSKAGAITWRLDCEVER